MAFIEINSYSIVLPIERFVGRMLMSLPLNYTTDISELLRALLGSEIANPMLCTGGYACRSFLGSHYLLRYPRVVVLLQTPATE